MPCSGETVSLLAGADLLQAMTNGEVWPAEDVTAILRDFGMVVLERAAAGRGVAAILSSSAVFDGLHERVTVVVDAVPLNTSSTAVRKLLAEGLSIRCLVPNGVAEVLEGGDWPLPANNNNQK